MHIKGGTIFIDVKKAFDSVEHDGLRYKLIYDSLPSSLSVRLSQFADDIGIWTHAGYAKWVNAKLSKALKLVEAWCSKWLTKLNAGKTDCI